MTSALLVNPVDLTPVLGPGLRMLADESVLSLVTETGVPEQALHLRKSRGRVNAIHFEVTTSSESQALPDAYRRIMELEDEFALVKVTNDADSGMNSSIMSRFRDGLEVNSGTNFQNLGGTRKRCGI